jgi:hypothetical protein
MTPLFAILIPTTPDRQPLLDRLLKELNKQRAGHNCIIIINNTERHDKGGPTTGQKRNELLDEARKQGASHIAFFDSDDLPGPNYIERNMEAVNGDYDCAELYGQYYENNKQLNPFHHSIVHDHWYQDDKFYYRNPNHLNCIKLDILKDIRFQDKTVGEDGHYSIDIQKAGILKREYPIKEIIYFYFAGDEKKKNHRVEHLLAMKRGTAL